MCFHQLHCCICVHSPHADLFLLPFLFFIFLNNYFACFGFCVFSDNDKAVIGFLVFLIIVTSVALLLVVYKIYVLKRKNSQSVYLCATSISNHFFPLIKQGFYIDREKILDTIHINSDLNIASMSLFPSNLFCSDMGESMSLIPTGSKCVNVISHLNILAWNLFMCSWILANKFTLSPFLCLFVFNSQTSESLFIYVSFLNVNFTSQNILW